MQSCLVFLASYVTLVIRARGGKFFSRCQRRTSLHDALCSLRNITGRIPLSVADRLPETPERRAPPNALVSLTLVSQSAWPDLSPSATDTFGKMGKLPSLLRYALRLAKPASVRFSCLSNTRITFSIFRGRGG